ncbi:DUF1801 domain-containing protein [Dyadobacter crusticola]|uniref:DUF1801 domain-containing protein n=1 Tax=Dyadobacter crusticola TaxID=292407 RepID=UPI0004E11987|nr:DUF1801 domain-containing protein [Dyadobacter crusticola]
MMLKDIDRFFWEKPEPVRSCLSALRYLIKSYDPAIEEVWQYSTPFYRLGKKRLCYIWIEKKTGRPYLGIVNGKLIDHPQLIAEKRLRMKILLLDAGEDLPVELIMEILNMAAALP